MNRSRAVAAGTLILLTCTAAGAHAADAKPTGRAAPTAASWCAQQGGTAQKEVPYYTKTGTQMVQLGGEREMCTFTAKDGSRIMIAADSLAADKPTLAALAYVHAPKDPGGKPGNPSIAYCQTLNGTAMYGPKPTDGGGWAPPGETNPEKAVSACMFGDGSVIDAWGLKYKEGGVIRGADLTKKFRATIPGA